MITVDGTKFLRPPNSGIMSEMKRFAAILLLAAGLAVVSYGQDEDRYRDIFGSENVEAKRTALLEIRNLHSEAASRAAIPALTDRKVAVRAAAATAVIYLPGPEAVSVLTPLLNDKAAFVRGEAAFALGKVGDASATQALIDSLRKDKAREVRSAVAIAMGKIGDPNAVAALTAVLTGKPSGDNELLRRSAARSIGEIANAVRSANTDGNLPASRVSGN